MSRTWSGKVLPPRGFIVFIPTISALVEIRISHQILPVGRHRVATSGQAPRENCPDDPPKPQNFSDWISLRPCNARVMYLVLGRAAVPHVWLHTAVDSRIIDSSL